MPTSATPRPSAAKTKTLLVGFDLGTNKSCVLAGAPNSTDIAVSKVVPTVVGYVKDGIVDGIIAGNAQVLYGDDALRNMLHVRLVAPLAAGVISAPDAARDFLRHARSLVDPSGNAEIRAVIGVPANAGAQAREDIRRCSFGIFDRVLLIPEPFLAALGFRDDSRLGQSNYIDPVVNSLFIDIGGGTSDLCLVQGYFPTADDQISIPFAGDGIDELLHAELIASTRTTASRATRCARSRRPTATLARRASRSTLKSSSPARRTRSNSATPSVAPAIP
jgi:rod shape-determining protein MreB